MPPPPYTQRVRISPLGDTALLAELGSRLDTALNTRAIALAAALRKRRDVRQVVAGYTGVTVHFDPEQTTVEALGSAVKRLAAKRPKVEVPGRLHRIPVIYDGEDFDDVIRTLGISRDELIAKHTSPIYRVFLVGFVPGWAYLGPLPEELYLPRRQTPRMQVPAGSVAIAARQTGIYPLPTPGGWHILGRTSVKVFLPNSDPPCLFRSGDRVKFFAA